MIATPNLSEDRWGMLVQPAHGGAENPRYLQLLAALDQGWKIAPPVYHRPRWLDGGEVVYHFFLNHDDHPDPCLITVPDDTAVREFVSDRRIVVL